MAKRIKASTIFQNAPIEQQEDINLQANECTDSLAENINTDIKTEIYKLTNEKSEMANSLASALSEIDSLKEEISKKNETIDNLTMQISDLTFRIAKIQAESQQQIKKEENDNSLENQAQTREINDSKQIYYHQQPQYLNNGYKSWN